MTDVNTPRSFQAAPAGVPQSYLDTRMLANIKEARENAYELCCSQCGSGISDDSDIHDYWCSVGK